MSDGLALTSVTHTRPLALRRSRRFTREMSEQRDQLAATMARDVMAIASTRDVPAFRRVFDFYAPRVKAYLRKLGAGDDVADDIAQEVLLSVWRRATLFDPAKASVGTWVFTIARNRWIDTIRRERRPDLDMDDPSLEPSAPVRGDLVTEFNQLSQQMKLAMEELPQEQKELVEVFFFHDKTHSVIAEELGIPLGTVKSRLRLALAKLRTSLGGVV